MDGRQMTNAGDVLAFVLGGKATFTLVSKRTGERFTYNVAKPTRQTSVDEVRFVNLLNGPNNEDSYQYLGFARQKRTAGAAWSYDHGRKSKISEDAPSARALKWFFAALLGSTSPLIPENVEFWHEGTCCRCGRPLTVPLSIQTGIGPECAKKTGRDQKSRQLEAVA